LNRCAAALNRDAVSHFACKSTNYLGITDVRYFLIIACFATAKRQKLAQKKKKCDEWAVICPYFCNFASSDKM
jgi:hypothetical protein